VLLERVQHRFTRLFSELRGLPYDERLRQLGLWSLEERRNRADLIEVFKMFKGFTAVPWTNFFRKSKDSRTRGHSLKLVKNHYYCNARLQFFSQRVISRCNNLSQDEVDVPSINSFKSRLKKRRSRHMDFFKDLQQVYKSYQLYDSQQSSAWSSDVTCVCNGCSCTR